jgi:carboxyl-terminal processing protease
VKPTRSIALVVSASIVMCLLGGGLAVKVGAAENGFREVVVFSEVLALVLDNYVDPTDANVLLEGAFEGMLAGLDPHGAYLTPTELAQWKAFRGEGLSAAGFSVLRAGRALQVVAVEAGSSAERAGLAVGDQIRSIDDHPVRDLSLDQSWRRILGAPGSVVTLDVFHATGALRRGRLEIVRGPRVAPAHELRVDRGIAVLRVHELRVLNAAELARELGALQERGVEQLLIDLRNVADADPRAAALLAGLVGKGGVLLQLKSRSGEIVEAVESPVGAAWKGGLTVLVNGATAGGAEALASLVRSDFGGTVLGEATYGLGAEPTLYEMEDGSGLLVSAARWETPGGGRWHGDGLEPDEAVSGQGADYAARLADQLEKAVAQVAARAAAPAPEDA